MTAETQKKNHHHHTHHHHHHTHKKIVHLKSIERITSLPVVESAHAYYERIKNSNPLIKWSLLPAETGVWLAVGTAMPVVTYFEKPVSTVDNIVCLGLDVIEANLPVVTYPPEVVYNITKDYVTSKVVVPVLKRADSVKQLSISGANMCGEMAATRLNNVINVADKYVEKYLPDISDTTDSNPGESESQNRPAPNFKSKKSETEQKKSLKNVKQLHVYSDGHGKLLADKLMKSLSSEAEVYVCVNPGAPSRLIVSKAIKGIETFTKCDAVVLIAGSEDIEVGGDIDKAYHEFLTNVETFSYKSSSTSAFVCPIFPQYDLPPTAVVNSNISRINNQLTLNMSRRRHIALLDVSFLHRTHFTRNGLHLNKNGRDVLASIIAFAVNNIADNFNEVPSGVANVDSKTAKTIQHVNQFSRKLQRRLTRRTIAEAKALKQQGADTIRCLVYLVDLLARDPKAFMEKAKEMWLELSKDEPENQVPPANLDQLIAMLTREMARRVVHFTNYAGTKVVLLSNYGVLAVHVGALNAVWWADYLIKVMHLDSAMDMAASQITNIHHLIINLLERLVERIRKLKQENLKCSGTRLPALPASPQQSSSQPTQQSPSQSLQQSTSQPPQQSPSQPPQQVQPHPSPTSSTSSGSSSSSATLTNKPTPSQNGDTHTVQESNHETAPSS